MCQAALLVTVITIVIVSGCIGQLSPNKREFGGKTLTFRANLTAAAEVPIFPSEALLLQTLYDPRVSWVNIAYIPNDTENGFYAVTGYELAFKLAGAYKAMFSSQPTIRPLELNATPTQPPRDEVTIWMRGPAAGANQTAVTVDNGIIIVEGIDLSEINRTYTDLDLAADRLLLSFMWPPPG